LFGSLIKNITDPLNQEITKLTKENKEYKAKLLEKQTHIDRTNAYWAQQVEKLKQQLKPIKNKG
jgi:flagellar capping protein FliD